MTLRNVLGIALGGAFALAPRLASAAEANGLGDRSGQVILSADRLFHALSYSSRSTTVTENNVTRTTSTRGTSSALLVGFEPSVEAAHTVPRVALDVTLIPRLTLGGSVALAFGLGGSRKEETSGGNQTSSTEFDAPKSTLFGIAPRVGYILPLGDVLAFWPRGGFSYYSFSTKSESQNNNNKITTTDSDSIFSLDLDPQLVIVPVEHFFFNLGLLVNVPISGSTKHEVATSGQTTTTSYDLSVFHFGVSAGLGGFL